MTRQYWANLALCIVLGALAILFVTQAGSALTSKGLFVSDPQPSNEAAKLLQDVILTEYRIEIAEGPEKMVEADFTIRNNSGQSIKNISVLCEFFDDKAKYRDRKVWKLAETIPAEDEVKISSFSKRFVSASVRIVNCDITDFQLVKKPFFTLERYVGGGHEKAPETGSREKSATSH